MNDFMDQGIVAGTLRNCPHCGHDRVAARVVAWADFEGGKPFCFDPADIDYVEPITGSPAICRSCKSTFTIAEETNGNAERMGSV